MSTQNFGLKRREDLVTREVEEDLLVYDPESDEIFLLNPTAAAIFELLDGEHDLEAIVTLLSETFGIEREVVERDIERLIADMATNGLLERAPPAPQEGAAESGRTESEA